MFGATAAVMAYFKEQGNDFYGAINAAEGAWFEAYCMGDKHGMTDEAREFISHKHLCGIGLRLRYFFN